MPKHYVTPQELGRAWFIQAVQGHTLVTLLPWRRGSIFDGVNKALGLELQMSWEASDHGKMLYKVLPRVGRGWQPLDIDWVPRRGVTLVARFLTVHCHLGSFTLLWDPLESVSCLLCYEEFSLEHLLWGCSIASEQREDFLIQGLEIWGKDLGGLAHLSVGSLSRFLLTIQPTFQMGSMEGVFGG